MPLPRSAQLPRKANARIRPERFYRPVAECLEERLPFAPVITSNGGGDTAAIALMTGATAVTSVTASGPDGPFTFSLAGGADQALFEIDSAGALRFHGPVNFSTPIDSNRDNAYVVDVLVRDSLGLTDQQALTVTIGNLVTMANKRDLIFDHVRNQVLVTTTTGLVERIDATTGARLTPLNVGLNLNGGDITPDGSALWVTDNTKFTGTQGNHARVYKVNLATGAVTIFTYLRDTNESGGWDLAIDANGIGYVDGQFEGSGSVQLRKITTATGVIDSSGHANVQQETSITRGPNRATLLFLESNTSSGRGFNYTTANGFSPRKDSQTFHDGDQASVSRNGDLIASEGGGGTWVYDRNFAAVQELPGIFGGMIFSPVADVLYGVDSVNDQVVAFDTNTWKTLSRLPIGENVITSAQFGSGVTTITPDGSRLFLSTASGVRIIDLVPAAGTQTQLALSGFSGYVAAGATTSITLTARDAVGNLLPNFSGTVRFGSSDASANLPADYTFTPGDGGTHTFTFNFATAGNQTVNVRDLANPSVVSVTTAVQVHTAATTFIPVSNPRDLVFDAARNVLYVTTSAGTVQRYSLATDGLLEPWIVGNSSYGADITADATALYVTDGVINYSQGVLRKVDLASGAVSRSTYDLDSAEDGGWDVAVSDDGFAYFDTDFRGSGWVPLRKLNLATGAISVETRSGRSSVRMLSQITRAGNYSRLLFQEAEESSGPIFLLSAAGFAAEKQLEGFNDSDLAAVSRDGELIAVELGSALVIFDRNYQAVEEIRGLTGGVAFHPTQNLLLGVDPATDQVIAYDTVTWRERYRVSVGADVGNSEPLTSGVTAMSADGSRLFLSTTTGVRVITLPVAAGPAKLDVSDYSPYLATGTDGNLTVTVRDATGAAVTDYAGTIHFTSNDPSATLPPDYTFQPQDGGVKSFVFRLNTAGSRSITVTSTTAPTVSGVASPITVHSTPTALLPISGGRDLIFDAARNTLYVTTATGLVQRYHVGTDSLLSPVDLGNSLWGGDITPDAAALYVQEDQRNAAQLVLRKLNLNSGVASRIVYDRAMLESGGWDIAVDGNGTALASTQGSYVPLRYFSTTTDAFSPTGQDLMPQRPHITRSADRTLMLLQESDISSGRIFNFQAPGVFSAEVDTDRFNDSSLAAVSPDGALTALELNGNVVVFDRSFQAVQQLVGYGGGLIFHPDGLLLVIDVNTDQVVAFDTVTWKERYRVAVGENVSDSSPFVAGVTALSADAAQLFLLTGSGVRIIRLPAATGVASRIDLVDHSAYTAADSPIQITVAIRDAAGRPVPNYTGQIHFTSTDPSATLPEDYTFTAGDAGVHRFNVTLRTAGSRTITVSEVGGGGLVSVSSAVQVHVGQSVLLPIVGARDLVFDSTRNLLYVTTAGGAVERYSVGTDSLLEAWKVGATLYGADITADSSSLYIQEGARNASQGMIRKLELQTGVTTNLRFNRSSLEGGGWDLAIAADGRLFADSMLEGSGTVPLRRLDTPADTFVTSGHSTVRQSTHVVRGENRNLLTFLESQSTDAFTYSNGAFSADINQGRTVTGTFAAINAAGTSVAMSHTGNVTQIRNASLVVQKTLTGYGGLAFRPGTNLLYFVNQVSGQIEVYDGAQDWALRQSQPIGVTLSGSTPLGTGTTAFSADGNRLFVITATGVRVYDTADTIPPLVTNPPTDQTIFANGTTGPLSFSISDNITPAASLLVTATSSDPVLLASLSLGGSGANRTLTITPASGLHGEATVTVRVADLLGNTTTFSFRVNVILSTLYVTALTPTSAGVRATFSRPFLGVGLNMFNSNESGPADWQLVGVTNGVIAGSTVLNAANTELTFVATAGVLPPDNYTLTMRSASNSVQSPTGELLDGDANGTAGGNFTQSFAVAAPAANTRTVSLPHIARGPDQALNAPADLGLGLPLSVSNADRILTLALDLRFEPELLSVTGVTLPPDVPPGSVAALTPLETGRVRITLTFSSPLASGPRFVAYLQSSVPNAAAARYGEREVLDISAVDLHDDNGQPIPATDQDAVHINAYFGDVGRNGKYDSFDVQQASRLAVRLDTGFQQHPLLDPTILADFNGNGRIDSFDVQQLSRLALRLPVSGVAALPSPLPTTTDTDRLTAEEPVKSEPAKTVSAPRSDIDGNGAVDAQDVAWAIYYFNRSENGVAPTEAEGKKLDLNGDQSFDSADILLAVTDLNAQTASAEAEYAVARTDDTDEDFDALASLLAEDIVTSRKNNCASHRYSATN